MEGPVSTNFYQETLIWMYNLYIGMMHERCKVEVAKLGPRTR